ncbi:MAG: hypothetical protein IT371_30365 [Deltaproteobacteria bacterium]|nr:hypothetical protein [Deltaproteobacteria bacterium]
MTWLKILHTSDLAEARALAREGYTPVECSIGGESVVDDLAMDHHGAYSYLDGVAVRAYTSGYHRGSRVERDARFVVTGAADADATFAIAALAGLLPDGLSDLAALVNAVDVDPFSIKLEEQGDNGARLLLFNQMASGVEDATAFYSGVDRWRMLTGPRAPEALLKATLAQERSRVEGASRASIEAHGGIPVAFVRSALWGFDVWYRQHPCVVAFHDGKVTVGCRDLATAVRLFGPGGLKGVFSSLAPAGWGGRETVGGSPRGLALTESQAREAFATVCLSVRKGAL